MTTAKQQREPKQHEHWHDFDRRKNGSVVLYPCECGQDIVASMQQRDWTVKEDADDA